MEILSNEEIEELKKVYYRSKRECKIDKFEDGFSSGIEYMCNLLNISYLFEEE